MHLRFSQIFAAALIVAGTPVALAQVVPPPAMPGGPTVAPPIAVKAIQPEDVNKGVPAAAETSEVTASNLLSVALPAAPKPPAALTSAPVDLKPGAPAGAPSAQAVAAKEAAASQPDRAESKPAAKKSKTARTDVKEVAAKLPADPYAGLVGTPVSDAQLNRFVFPEPIEGIYFPEGSPLPECPENAAATDLCAPQFLNGKKVLLLQLRAGARGPVQMIAHLESGRFETLNLMPAPGPGAVVRIDGAEDGPSDTRIAAAKRGDVVGAGAAQGLKGTELHVDLLSKFASGDIPAGFEPVKPSTEVVRFSLFDVYQQASWDSGIGQRVHLYRIHAHSNDPVAISPALFTSENVKALALDRDTITATQPAYLFMLEAVPTQEK